MANLTKAQRYNKRLNEIFDPEFKRLRLCSDVAKEILTQLNDETEIDPCGLEPHHLIDLVARIIRKNYFNFNSEGL